VHTANWSDYKCSDCAFETKQRYKLGEHVKAQHGHAFFACAKCAFNTIYSGIYKDHMCQAHNNNNKSNKLLGSHMGNNKNKHLGSHAGNNNSKLLGSHWVEKHALPASLAQNTPGNNTGADLGTPADTTALAETKEIIKHDSPIRAPSTDTTWKGKFMKSPSVNAGVRNPLLAHPQRLSMFHVSPREPKYNCENCDFKTANKRELERHVRMHRSRVSNGSQISSLSNY
jgi:hypothetical protein